MELIVVGSDWTTYSAPLLAVPIFEGESGVAGAVARVDERLEHAIAEVVSRGNFKGKAGQTLVLFPRAGDLSIDRVLLVGVGRQGDLSTESLRRAAATALKEAGKFGIDRFATLLHVADLDRVSAQASARAVAEGSVLGSYTFDEFRTSGDNSKASGVGRVDLLEYEGASASEIEGALQVGSAIARGENYARNLGDLPGNVATPTYLGERARDIADRFGMSVTVLGPEELRSESMNALLAVSQGSEQEPRFIVLEHRKGPANSRPIVLVGKGLTFDAGGISIKPAASMEEMKFDMCGGASVLGAMHAIGELDVPVNVIGVVPSSENLLSGKAMKPGDIIRSHLGKTIEVVNTDAEGRLILADALSYVRRFDPLAVVDMATLTGACVIALGHHASALLGNDEALIQELREAGDRVGQRVWQLPMLDEYRDQIKSDYADIKNSGGRPAGTITAAWFLREFVGEMRWAHLDIAGTAYGDGKLPYQTKGSTGVPTRLLVDWVLSRAA